MPSIAIRHIAMEWLIEMKWEDEWRTKTVSNEAAVAAVDTKKTEIRFRI